MNEQLLLVGEDQFFHSREIFENHNILQVASTAEASGLVERFEFEGIIARDGAEILKQVRAQGKHTPFLNISHAETISDCCGGHLSPEATLEEKTEAFQKLLRRSHNTEC